MQAPPENHRPSGCGELALLGKSPRPVRPSRPQERGDLRAQRSHVLRTPARLRLIAFLVYDHGMSTSPPTTIFRRLSQAFNDGRKRAILCGGQAVVMHRLAVMSKDGDWIIREDDESVGHVLSTLQRFGAHAVICARARRILPTVVFSRPTS